MQIATGRRDGMVSEVTNVRPNMVDTSFTVDDMMKIFSSKGLSLEDLVILSGIHNWKILSSEDVSFMTSTLKEK